MPLNDPLFEGDSDSALWGLTGIALIIPCTLFKALMFSIPYGWYLIPLGFPHLTVVQIASVVLTLGMISSIKAHDLTVPAQTNVNLQLARTFITHPMMVGMLWLFGQITGLL